MHSLSQIRKNKLSGRSTCASSFQGILKNPYEFFWRGTFIIVPRPRFNDLSGQRLLILRTVKPSKVASILQRFDPAWATLFLNEIERYSGAPDEIKNSIDTVVANRHTIAHGRHVGVTYASMATYYDNIKVAVQILDTIIK